MNAITKGYQDVPMTRRRAQLLEEYASKLADMLEAAPNDKDLAEWVQSKVDRAAAAIQSAYHYLDQDDESDLEKAVGHKYTHRKRVGTDKKGRARYRYYYAEHQGGGISRAKFEAGSAFKLTWKGRRGHFHIDRVEGDQIFITHDSRPDMEPVPVQADELRALLRKQHSKAEQKHVEKRQREVEEIKRRAHRGGLGLALHRLRQAAAQAGVSLPEQYQRKPKKTRARLLTPSEMEEMERYESYLFGANLKQLDLSEIEAKVNDVQTFYEGLKESNPTAYQQRGRNKSYRDLQELKRYVRTRKEEGRLKGEVQGAETAREVEAPEVEAPRTKAETARAIHKDLEQAGFKGARIWVVDEGTGKEKARIYIKGKWNGVTSESGYLDIMTRTHYTDAGEAEPTRDIGLDLSEAPSLKNSQVIPFLEMLDKHRDLLLDPSLHLEGDRDDNRIERFLDHFSQTDYTKLDPESPLQDHDEKAQALARARGADTLSDLAASINNALYSLLRKQVKPVIEENARKIYGDKETPRDQLTSTAQQIIEDANQEHAERHEEHQEITRFELGEHTHTKTGVKLFTAKQTERVDRDEYFRRVEIAKKYKGRYERRYVGGFVFKSAEDARAFALEVEGAAQEAPETSAETVTPHDEHPGADNFETMPEVESARATTATVRDVQSTLKASRRADKLTSTGRRARASINADKELIEAAQRALDEGYRGMESPAFIPLNERTPRQANYQRLKGALNGFKSSQTLTRGSWTDDHKSLQKKRIKARDQLDEALKELDQIARSQEHAQVSIEDLPPKGQRTVEDAKRFFGEPQYFERIEGSKTKRYVIYERDGHRIVGPASGRGKGKFSHSFSWDTPRYRSEREQGNIIAGPDSLTYQEIGDYDTLDEALTRTVNQYRSQDEMIDKLIEKEKERLAQGRKELERLNATPREQLTATAREVTQGAEVPPSLKERVAKLNSYLGISDVIPKEEAEEWKVVEREQKSLFFRGDTRMPPINSIMEGRRPSRLSPEIQAHFKRLENLMLELEQMEGERTEGGRLKNWQGIKAKRQEALSARRDLLRLKSDRTGRELGAIQDASYLSYNLPQRSTATPEDVGDKHGDRRSDLKTLRRYFETYEPTLARQALTETTERVTSDQTAEQATTRATPRPSEETLRGSGELDETVRANLQDRAQYLLRMPEDTTKTGRRSKRQKARDGELLLIHRRLQSDAQERLGPTAPRFADYSQLVGMPRADQPENAETRAQFRTALKDAIRELEQATSGQVTKSARPLITYRAQLIQTVERLTAA